jgi:hypothetical protein
MARVNELEGEIEELEAMIEQARAVLEDAYEPETDRATAIEAIADALDILGGSEEDSDLEADSGDDGEE